jgi:hypothetical protein
MWIRVQGPVKYGISHQILIFQGAQKARGGSKVVCPSIHGSVLAIIEARTAVVFGDMVEVFLSVLKQEAGLN